MEANKPEQAGIMENLFTFAGVCALCALIVFAMLFLDDWLIRTFRIGSFAFAFDLFVLWMLFSGGARGGLMELAAVGAIVFFVNWLSYQSHKIDRP